MLLIAVVCMFGQRAHGTSIIAVRTSTEIVLGADSKLISTDGTITRAACKIGVSKDVSWGEAGILEIPSVGFSIAKMASDIMGRTTDPVETRISTFENRVSPELINVLKAMSHDYFLAHYKETAPLEMVFAYFEDAVPHVDGVTFMATSRVVTGDISLEIIRVVSPSNKFPDTMVESLGRHEAADQEVNRFPNIWGALGIPWAVRHLIETEINAVPAEVGRPIAILAIDKTGPRWISEGQCASSQQEGDKH
jgi:hypothetical protein